MLLPYQLFLIQQSTAIEELMPRQQNLEHRGHQAVYPIQAIIEHI